jgi:hypothetical protein
MSKRLFPESFPGSGVTKDGIRINPNMPDYGKLPFVIEKNRRAKATLDKYGIEFFRKMLKGK